jgi:glycosyltransferase involved in cell wall biosynthesis
MPFSFGAQVPARINELVIRAIEYGGSSGLAQSKIFPKGLKSFAVRVYERRTGKRPSGILTWSRSTFLLFWIGDYFQLAETLESKLTAKQKIGSKEFDFITRLTWHAAKNVGMSVTDSMQSGFEYHLAQRAGGRNDASLGTQAQWLSARLISGGAPINWEPNAEIIAIASHATDVDFKISDDLVKSIAAIRFGIPELWLTGHETKARPELQIELALWVHWLNISKDIQLWRHANNVMRTRSLFSGSLVINEGMPENSQLPLAQHGLKLPNTPSLIPYIVKKNRVLYFLHNSLPWDSQGYATRSHAIIKSLNSNGWQAEGITRLGYPYDRHDVSASQDIPADQVIDGVQYHRLGRKIGQMSLTFNFLSRYCERSAPLVQSIAPEIIHAASNYWNGLAATHLAAQVGVPSVYEVRGLWEVTRRSATPGYEFSMSHRFYVKLETQAALQASHVFALTGALRDELVRRGVPTDKITLLPNAVDESRFFPLPRDSELEQKFGYERKTVIGYVGSLLAYEGLDLLLRAVAQLAKVRDDFRVLIVGSGAEHENLLTLMRELNLGNIVDFTGRVPHSEVEKYYSLIDIAPFPRLPLPVCEMVSPLKPFEAMAMEKACIVSSCAALTEIVQDGITGRVFEKGSHESLATVLKELLDNPEAVKEFGKAGREWVLENRTWSKNAIIVQEVYERLLAK